MTTGIRVQNKQGRYVGHIDDRIFVKEVYGNKHMLRQPMAWAIDCDIFDRVIERNCGAIHIIDKDTNTRYISGVKSFRQNCKRINRKHGDQYYLELVYWNVTTNVS